MQAKIVYQMARIKVENTEITVVSVQNEDYISLTDMAHSQMQEHIVFRWMSLKSTIEYLGEWEMLYSPNFNCTEFDTIRNAAGSNNFVLSVKYEEHPLGPKGRFACKERRAHQRWHASGRTTHQTQSDCHPTDAGAGGQ